MPGTSVKRMASALAVVLLVAGVTSILMTSLRSAKPSALRQKMGSAEYDGQQTGSVVSPVGTR